MNLSRGSVVALFGPVIVLGHVICCGAQPAPGENAVEARIARITSSLQQPLIIEGQPVEHRTLDEAMRELAVPAVSVAVIDNGELAWARAWGVIEAGSDAPVTPENIFQAGSVSKPVTALLALALVDDGVLDLDRPLNEVLRSWKVPDNEFTRTRAVTLRHTITHQAGFTPFAYSKPRDGRQFPAMAELLAGGIDDWPAVGVEFVPGSRLAYSNSGYCVLQLVLEDRSRLTLHQLASQLMFGPLKMGHSRFDDPISAELLATAASGHHREPTADGQGQVAVPVEHKARIAPAATGGLWTTPTDLAVLAIEVSRAWRGESDVLISKQLARAFLTPQIENEGLGIYLQGEGPTLAARHGGSMTGFTTQLVFYPEAGKGVALMVNSEGAGAQYLATELIASIADEYAWPGYPVRRTLATATPQQLDELVGVYGADSLPNFTFSVTVKDGVAFGQVNQYSPFEMQPTTEADLFVQPSESLEIVFRRADDGRVAGVELRRAGDIGSAFSRR